MKTTKQLAVIALSALNPHEDLVGRNHVDRVKAGIGWNGNASDWERRSALKDASMITTQHYRSCSRVWAFAVAADLTNSELATVAKFKRTARKHVAQLTPKPVASHDTRPAFGKYLVKLGVTERAARHFVYGAVKQGVTVEKAIAALREIKETGGISLNVPWHTVWVDTHGHGPENVAVAAQLCAV